MTGQIVMAVLAYLGVGLTSAVVLSRYSWASRNVKEQLKLHPYEQVAREMRISQLFTVGLWPYVLFVRLVDVLMEVNNPHPRHLRELDQRMTSYEEMAALQRSLGQEVDVEMPLAWCACQRSLKRDKIEQRHADSQIQHRVELLLKKVSQVERDDWPNKAAQLKMLTREVKRHALDIEDYMKKANRWS